MEYFSDAAAVGFDAQVAVLVVELVVFRVLQVFFLSKLNNIEK